MKPLHNQLNISMIKQAFILSLVYFLLFNTSIILYKYSFYKSADYLAFAELYKEAIYVYLMIFIGFLGFSINDILLKAYSLFLYFTGAFVSYYIYTMKILPNKHMVKAFFDVESVEAYELVSLKLIAFIVISLSICGFLLKRYSTQSPQGTCGKTILFFLMILSIANIITPFYRVFSSYLPINYLNNTYYYFYDKTISHTKLDITKHNKFSSNTREDMVAVLVIGESARYDHFSINGYPRQTTPRLSAIKNLQSYKATASSNMTYLSVASMLSRVPMTDPEGALDENSMLSIFTKLGFNTIWIATQSLTKYYRNQESNLYDEVNLALIPGGSVLYSLSSYDEVMLPYLKDALTGEKKTLIILHTSGSHWNYSARYPKEFAKFTPGCEVITGKVDHSVCGHEKLINSYDNSIYYTDYFLSEVINILKDKNAFLIYVSDHAESLGEDGFYGHGSEKRPEQLSIPFIFWFSDKYAEHAPDLKNITPKKNTVLSHDYIFHSMLDCANVSSSIINKNCSICHDRTR